ncbi:MAG: YggS family pyridoxal phosphate-dependent enzyme [Bacillota bacterium]|jgi:pyridoxal phosphate enzyme (YggS family)|nr:YggS family pyridoxal phosphate-dependent enzyme [Bacillota bacterium]NLJ03787.1 YggS family pyridoxal phosphate-dependent enzyme [Bacillota bacterium]
MSIKENLASVQARIRQAAVRSGRAESDIRLLGVTKYASDEQVQELINAGLTTLGENRVQNAQQRLERFPEAEWHFIGRLQTNKVRFCEKFALIHSLDRWNLAKAVDSRARQWGKIQDVLIQVNVSGEESKTGLSAREAGDFARRVLQECKCVRIRGLMTMAPLVEPEAARPFFRETRLLYENLQQELGVTWDILSMGMTNDFEVAIEEGATLVRIGTALFSEGDSA